MKSLEERIEVSERANRRYRAAFVKGLLVCVFRGIVRNDEGTSDVFPAQVTGACYNATYGLLCGT